ncbi:MAG TPA: beta-ketoacyl-[acyl-carrier-protein] synthase II [Ruminococcaceae bacterium]|nr:beta-ketoacyl-[acyl-carrier-protein] synthase II [Oscillospiraceae bacterium]
MKKRVVVTGMGTVNPLGHSVSETWNAVRAGKNGISEITLYDTADFKVKLAAEVKNLNIEDYIDRREIRRMDRFCQFGMIAAEQAYKDSGLSEGSVNPEDMAVVVGAGVGGIATLENETLRLKERGSSRVSPMMVPMIIADILGGNIAIKHGAKGECHCIVTACATGTDCIGKASRLIRGGEATVVISGSAEAAITPVAMAGFTNMKALSVSTDKNRASIPFDKERDGFVMGEGAAILVLEEYEHAKARGAKIYAEIVGYGATCDAYHITSPAPEGRGAARAMKKALNDAGLSPKDISYINAHGTGTPPNDELETIAVKSVFGEHAGSIPMSSTKSMTGHMLGAAGSTEAIICIKALENGFIPPTINYKVPDEGLDLDYVPGEGRKQALSYALSNSLGFGGHNSSLIIKKTD